MFSTREYMGLDIGSERPCLFDAPEEVIRSDRVLSEVYDDIWEMGYRPHMFTGTPEMADGNFTSGSTTASMTRMPSGTMRGSTFSARRTRD